MSKTWINCSECKHLFEKETKEVTRQQRERGPYVNFFCSAKCNADFRVVPPAPFISKICQCKNIFETNTNATYCGVRCASYFSMTESRKASMMKASENTRFTSGTDHQYEQICRSLRSREWPKYVLMSEELEKRQIVHQFEYRINHRIFDLALPQIVSLVEFDEAHHLYQGKPREDLMKDDWAIENGWNIYRVKISRNTPMPFPIELIQVLIDDHYR